MKKVVSDIIVSLFIVFMVAAAGELLSSTDDVNTNMMITVISLTAALIFIKSRHDNEFRFKPCSLNDAGVAILIGAFTNIPFATISKDGINTYLRYGPIDKFTFIMCLVLLLPAVEEIYFRGFLFKKIAHHYGACTGGTISIIIFTLAHVGQEGIIIIAVSGIMYTWLAYRTQNIVPTILAHSVHNLIWFVSARLA